MNLSSFDPDGALAPSGSRAMPSRWFGARVRAPNLFERFEDVEHEPPTALHIKNRAKGRAWRWAALQSTLALACAAVALGPNPFDGVGLHAWAAAWPSAAVGFALSALACPLMEFAFIDPPDEQQSMRALHCFKSFPRLAAYQALVLEQGREFCAAEVAMIERMAVKLERMRKAGLYDEAASFRA